MPHLIIHLFVFSFLFLGSVDHCCADGLIKILPPDGAWATYEVTTTLVQPDGLRTTSSGTLTVRSVGRSVITGKAYRWLEFEHSWEQEPTAQVTRRYHSSIQKFAIEEAAFAAAAPPKTEILTGFLSKTSAEEKPEKWEYPNFQILKPGHGSKNELSPMDYYARPPFENAIAIGIQSIPVSGETLECIGVEHSETTHRLGSPRNDVTTTAYRQWSSEKTPFGVVMYQFEILRMDGLSFEQHLKLKSTGENAITSLPNAK